MTFEEGRLILAGSIIHSFILLQQRTHTESTNLVTSRLKWDRLSHLDHPNIIQVRGIAAGPIKKSVASNDGFFVVLELLEKTLTDQISLWGWTSKTPEKRD